MKTILAIALTVACAKVLLPGTARALNQDPAELVPAEVSHVANVWSDSDFAFTVSPDDRWLLYFENLSTNDAIRQRRNMRIIDLKTGKQHALEFLPPSEWETGMVLTDRWTKDSRFWFADGLAVAFDGADGPRVAGKIKVLGEHIQIGDEQIGPSDIGFCSDCYEHAFDQSVLQKARGPGVRLGQRGEGKAIVSRDGKSIFYQLTDDVEWVEIRKRVVAGGEDELVVKHLDECVRARQLCQSPDGKFLAYQLGTGCGFSKSNLLYIVDLAQKKEWLVATNVFCVMHFTSDSQRLFYAGRDDTPTESLTIYSVALPNEPKLQQTVEDGKDTPAPH